MEALGYILLAGLILSMFLMAAGAAIALLSGPVLRFIGRPARGGSVAADAPPDRALAVLLWMGRIGGGMCFVAGAFLFWVYLPHAGSGWGAAQPRFESAPAEARLREIVVKSVKPMADDGAIAGLTIGIVDGDRTAVYGFGRKSAGNPAPPDGDTIYEIGSITKVFTSLALASLAGEGKVRLDEPLQELLGDDPVVPSLEGTPITLIDLSTHTSGLPRMQDDFYTARSIWATLTGGNPYARYTADRLMTALERCRLKGKPGTRFEYSNLGATLLGNALGGVAGQSYEDMIRTRLAGPLGMTSTGINLSVEQAKRRVPGHATLIDVGSWRLAFSAAPWDFPPGTEGAGGLKSSVNDLLRLMEAQMNPPRTDLGKAIEESQIPRRDTDMNDLRMGLAWHILEGLDAADPVFWHNGGTRGYSSFMGFCRKGRRGVVLLSNSFDTLGRLDGAGLEILGALKKP